MNVTLSTGNWGAHITSVIWSSILLSHGLISKSDHELPRETLEKLWNMKVGELNPPQESEP